MKPRILFLIFAVLAIFGGSGLLYMQINLPDIAGTLRDVSERLLKIDSLDAKVSELSLRSRSNIDKNYDNLVTATKKLDQSVADLESRYFNDPEIKGTEIEQSFIQFKQELSLKTDLVENFKSHNSVLRNSEKYMPIVGQRLIASAQEAGSIEQANIYADAVINAQEYSKQGESKNPEKLNFLLQQIRSTEKLIPKESLMDIIIDTIELTMHIRTVMHEKELTDAYLNKVLDSRTDSSMEKLSTAWGAWLEKKNTLRDLFQKLTIGYIILLFIITGLIARALRNLYSSLDQKVVERTSEIEASYKELEQSEKRLMQTEKMASLGQLVAGIAHEINTPLGYLSNNTNIIKTGLGNFKGILDTAAALSTESQKPILNKNTLTKLLNQTIKNYRQLTLDDTYNEISGLLEDSRYGLNEISQLVDSLNNFSRPDNADMTPTDVHDCLNASIRICGGLLENFVIEKKLAKKLPLITCIPSQINQALINILRNAAQALDPLTGKICIKTFIINGTIAISITDNGHGMSKETISRMFDPFFTTKEVNEGTGLGMAICYKIITNHGGNIDIKSNKNEGTTITVSLPTAEDFL